MRIFIGYGGGGSSILTDQSNALGNHLGSYHIDYTLFQNDYKLQFYYQSIFEDRSGRELKNFPDGVWGIYYNSSHKSIFSKILYEYQQTVSQSGSPKVNGSGTISGGDYYFYNGIYKSGWTYFNRSIGTPFIKPDKSQYSFLTSRSTVHHFGLSGEMGHFKYIAKISFAKNYGTYNQPFEKVENAVYTFSEVSYASAIGNFQLSFGYDYSNRFNKNLGGAFSYLYRF